MSLYGRLRIADTLYFLTLCTGVFLLATPGLAKAVGMLVLLGCAIYNNWRSEKENELPAELQNAGDPDKVVFLAGMVAWGASLIGGPILAAQPHLGVRLCGLVIITCGTVWVWIDRPKRPKDPA